MNYHECKHCGVAVSYPAELISHNEVIASLITEGWDFVENDTTYDWYCPDCIRKGFLPGAYVIPKTVEYRGFTIHITMVDTGDGYPILRFQIREDPDYITRVLYNDIVDNVEQEVAAFIALAKEKIDLLYDLFESTLDKFEQMVIKQARRQHIDSRIPDKVSNFKMQMQVVSTIFKDDK